MVTIAWRSPPEFTEETLQWVIIRKLVKPTATEVERKIAGVIRSWLNIRLYTN
ncbi:hypothetical protein D3C71_1889600 [compost metagenome]